MDLTNSKRDSEQASAAKCATKLYNEVMCCKQKKKSLRTTTGTLRSVPED